MVATGPVFAERTGSIGKSCAYLSVVGKRETPESLAHRQFDGKYLDGHQFVACSQHQVWPLRAWTGDVMRRKAILVGAQFRQAV